MQKFAILIDYENFPCPPEGLTRLLADFSRRGTMVVKRAYADWVRFPVARQLLLANQVEMIELPCASKGKNSADIRLVVDAMELLFTKPHISAFVIVSGDADFLPLLSRLRENNKQTIVVARTRNLHAYMRTHCDEFIDGDGYLANTSSKPSSAAVPMRVESKLQLPTPEQVRQIQELIVRAWQSHGLEQPLDLPRLGSELKKLDEEVDWKVYGFKSLQPLVAYLVTKGFLRIELRKWSSNQIFLNRPFSGLNLPSKTVTSTFQVGDMKTDDVEGHEAALVALMKDIIHNRIRWDLLLSILTQIRPHLLRDMQSEDLFLKQMQSLDARGKIDLQYDANEETYFVSLPLSKRMSQRPVETSSAWTQPELF